MISKSLAYGKNQLTITINVISSKHHIDEERVIHSKIDNTKIMISDEVNDVIKKTF